MLAAHTVRVRRAHFNKDLEGHLPKKIIDEKMTLYTRSKLLMAVVVKRPQSLLTGDVVGMAMDTAEDTSPCLSLAVCSGSGYS